MKLTSAGRASQRPTARTPATAMAFPRLAARHHIGLNQVGSPVTVTTGRRLAGEWPPGTDDVVVMLDSRQAFQQYARDDVDIFWGAYLGTPDEILIAGPLSQVADRIAAERAEPADAVFSIMQ